jgi:hypothetical protein
MRALITESDLPILENVREQSLLTHRRARAAQLLISYRYRAHSKRLAIALIILISIGCWQLQQLQTNLRAPRNRAEQLEGIMSFNSNEDRFHIIHYVDERDTIWQLSIRYYGSPRPANLQRIIAANAWISDVHKMERNRPLKVPIQ